MKLRKRIFWIAAAGLLLVMLVWIVAAAAIALSARGRVYRAATVSTAPELKTAVVLGWDTSRKSFFRLVGG